LLTSIVALQNAIVSPCDPNIDNGTLHRIDVNGIRGRRENAKHGGATVQNRDERATLESLTSNTWRPAS